MVEGSKVNALNFQAPVLSGGVNTNPPPAGILEFGYFSGGAGSGPVGIPFVLAKPSRCTVFIQNVLATGWLFALRDPRIGCYIIAALS
jgi:hypothetical protein